MGHTDWSSADVSCRIASAGVAPVRGVAVNAIIVVDTLGLLLCVIVTTALVQDRDGARPVLEHLTAAFRRVRLIWTDGGYAGKLVDWAHTNLKIVLQIVRRSEDATGFVVLPRRWVVERTLVGVLSRWR